MKYDDIVVEDVIIKICYGDICLLGVSGKFLSIELVDGEIFFKCSIVENVDMFIVKGDIVF